MKISTNGLSKSHLNISKLFIAISQMSYDNIPNK